MKLQTLEGMNTRPTTDRVKESLFNIIAPYLEGTTVLDLFAGTGSLGIEALSRGASWAAFGDQNEKCIQIIKNNLEHTKLIDKSQIILGESNFILKKLSQHHRKFDIIFLDPPYRNNIIPGILNELDNSGVLNDKVIIAAESDIEDILPENSGSLCVSREKIYGKTKLTFYKRI